MLNINRGHNQELMDACKTLRDYAEYTARVREYAEDLPIQEAVERAITECIKEDILAEFLQKNRAEAISVSIYEYDEEKTMRLFKEEGCEEGRETTLTKIILRMLDKGLSISEITDLLGEDESLIQKLAGQTNPS